LASYWCFNFFLNYLWSSKIDFIRLATDIIFSHDAFVVRKMSWSHLKKLIDVFTPGKTTFTFYTIFKIYQDYFLQYNDRKSAKRLLISPGFSKARKIIKLYVVVVVFFLVIRDFWKNKLDMWRTKMYKLHNSSPLVIVVITTNIWKSAISIM